MSFREAVLPDRALRDLLTSMHRRLAALDQRVRWPGAVRFEEMTPVALNGSDPSAPDFQPILYITLDPGVWILDFAATYEMTGTAPSGEPPLIGLLQIAGRTARWGVNSDGVTPWEAPLASFTRVTLTAITTLVLEGAVTTPVPASCSALVVDPYVIAQPV